MTDAPERIWVGADRGADWGYGWWVLLGPDDLDRTVPYIRADLAKAQAGALLRQASEACTSVIKNIDTLKAELADQRVRALVEAAYAEGFSEGADGGWIDGDYSKPWSKSDAMRAIGGE